MHWIFLILALIAIVLVSLGALSVWATVLLLSLKIVFARFAEKCGEQYHWLREYMFEHAEVESILRAVD